MRKESKLKQDQHFFVERRLLKRNDCNVNLTFVRYYTLQFRFVARFEEQKLSRLQYSSIANSNLLYYASEKASVLVLGVLHLQQAYAREARYLAFTKRELNKEKALSINVFGFDSRFAGVYVIELHWRGRVKCRRFRSFRNRF